MGVAAYNILEDSTVLIQYVDGHSELYSIEERSVIKEFSQKTAKYGLSCVGSDIYRVGEDWMSIDLIDTGTEQTVQSFKQSFKKLLKGWTVYRLTGYDNVLYLCDGNGIHFANTQKSKEFEKIEAPNEENKFGTQECAILAFESDEYGNLYLAYEHVLEGNTEQEEDELIKFIKYTVDETDG